MKIKGSFDGHPNIQPIILAKERCNTCGGKRVRLAGWGINEEGTTPHDLYEIEQNIQDNEECYKRWNGDITSRFLI